MLGPLPLPFFLHDHGLCSKKWDERCQVVGGDVCQMRAGARGGGLHEAISPLVRDCISEGDQPQFIKRFLKGFIGPFASVIHNFQP